MAHATATIELRSRTTATPTLPRPIRRALGRIDRRLRTARVLRSVGTSALIAALGAAAGVALDVAWPLPQAVRWAIWSVWVVAVATWLLEALARGLSARGRAVDLAAVLERNHPELGERLTGAVDLLDGPAHGSPVLIAALADDAAARVGAAVPARSVPLGKSARRFALGLTAVALAAAPVVVRPDPFARLARRFLMPWAAIERVGRFVVTVTPGDAFAAIGDDLNVTAEIAPRLALALPGTSTPTAATLEWTDGGGRTRRMAMAGVADRGVADSAPATRKPEPGRRAFRAVVPRLTGSVTYRVVARGTAESRWYRLTAVAAPAVAVLTARVEPPSYTKFPAHDARDPARIEAWEGSRVTLTVVASRPVQSVEVAWPQAGGVDKDQEPRAESQEPRADDRAPMTNDRAPMTDTEPPSGDRPSALGSRLSAIDHRSSALGSPLSALRPPPSVVGSAVRTADAPGRSAQRTLPDPPRRVAAPLAADGTTATVTLPAEVSGDYAITFRDEHGIVSRPEPPRRLVIRPDGPPSVVLRGVDGLDQSSAEDNLHVGIVARDDVAVATAELHINVDRAAAPGTPTDSDSDSSVVPARLSGLGTAAAEGSVLLALKTLKLKAGDVVSYRVRVTDNRPAPRGPNVAWSSARRLTIVARAEPLADRRSRADREELQAKLDAIKKSNAENRHETELLRYAADAVQRGNGPWDQERKQGLTDREAAARDVEDKLQALARDLDDDPAFAPLAQPARQVAGLEAEAARAALDQARRAGEPAQRLGELRRADSRLGAVATRLDELQRQFDALTKRAAERQRLQDLADRQAQVADRAENVAQPDRARLDQVEAEQNAVRNDLDTLLKTAPEMKADLLASQAAEAAALAKRAHDLAARRRDESRRATDLSGRAGFLKKLADAQRILENDARRLALDVDQPLAEAGRGRLNIEPIRLAAEPIERGDLPQGRQHLEGAEAELRRLARDLDDAPADLKALARRLAQRQERLFNDVAQALGEVRGKATVPDAGRAAVAGRLKPLEPLQKAIAEAAAGLLETREAKAEKALPRFPKETAQAAAKAAARAAESLRPGAAINPRDIEARSTAARDALNRLVNELPDPWQREEPVRKALAEARQTVNDALQNVDRHLRETEPQAATDPAHAAADLAARLAPVAAVADKAAAQLEAAATQTRIAPRVAPAAPPGRAPQPRLARAIEAVRAQAPSKNDADKPAFVPVTGWQVVGPLAIAAGPPFKLDGPINPAEKFKGRKKNETLAWKAAPADARGLVDLGKIYARDANIAAFAHAELTSPLPRRATLAVGSDDTLAVWVNGRRVYHFDGNRSFGHEQDKVDINLLAGSNRIVVKCGNKSSEWMFALAVSPPPPPGFEPEKARTLRDALAAAAVEARAGFDRLEQKLNNQVPADDLAAELAEEQQALHAEAAAPPAKQPAPAPRPEQADDQRRLATALRTLQAPDAPLEQAEAVRQAERAAEALDAAHDHQNESPAPAPAAAPTPAQAAARAKAAQEAVHQAATAVDALARRLNDRSTPRGRAETLARVERAANEPDAQAETAADPAAAARRQHAIAAELERIDGVAAKPDRKPLAVAAAKAVQAAADQAERATRPQPPGNGNVAAEAPPTPADLARRRDRAAAALDALARALPETPAGAEAKPATGAAKPDAPRDPDLAITPEQTAAARDLARRERRLRERLQTVLADRVPPQRALRKESAELGHALAELRDHTRDVSPRAAGPVGEAAALLGEHAPRTMDEAAAQLSLGQAVPARDAERRAAELVERGAQSVDDLAAALRADAAENAAHAQLDADADANANHLAAARADMSAAARDLAQARNAAVATHPLGDAPRAMRGAAQELQAAAFRARQGQGPPRDRAATAQARLAATNVEPRGQRAGIATPDELRELQALVRHKTGRNWGELPGHLRTEILQMSQGRYRDDYARLIQLYFREIAAGADIAPTPPPKDARP